LKELESAKYPGVNTYHRLNWNTHVNQVVKKQTKPQLFFI